MADWFAYLVKCSDGSYYAGVTTDPSRRCAQHNAGTGARYTRSRRPVDLAYVEPCPDRSAALRREVQLKRLSHATKETLARPAAKTRRRSS